VSAAWARYTGARDARLHRDVALKLLPPAFAIDPERLARFEREAQLLASLNHPHIAAIYGLEDGGGQRAIVMELVEGQDLTGPRPLDEALHIARQLAEAIEAAHERGVIHRDLKPANIKITPEGVVKVLDFGLAKALDIVDESHADAPTVSPSLALGATQAGVVLGTAAYMAPEQAKGKAADRRADVWAFGAVLYELLTGTRAFGGETVAETLASVIKDPVALGALPSDTPAPIRRLLGRCLERDVRRRLQSMGEARIVIEDVLAGRPDEPASAPKAPHAERRRSWLPWAVAAAGLTVAAVALARNGRAPVSASPSPVVGRFAVQPPDGRQLTNNRLSGPQQAVSPDGRYVAVVVDELAGGTAARAIWIRGLDSLVAQRLDRTSGASYPFWSPDSQHIAYFADGKLMRTAISGGAPRTVCGAPDGEGGTWFQTDGEGVIVFAPDQTGPLHRVPANGGLSAAVTSVGDGETGHVFPQSLPGGRQVLFTARGSKPGIYVQALDSGQRTRITEAQTRAMYAPPGFLLYVRDEVLFAHRFSLDALALEGEPVVVAEAVRDAGASARTAWTVSSNATLVYRSRASEPNVQVRWYLRDGKALQVVLEAGGYSHLELSPDGQRLAVSRAAANGSDLWVKDLVSGVFSRLTSLPGSETQPVWSPDSRQVAFVGSQLVLRYTAVGSGKQSPIAGSESYSLLEQWTPDGRFLMARKAGAVGLIPAPSDSGPSGATPEAPREVFVEPYPFDHFRVSPDGRWVAYTSEESGRAEVMVAAFPSFTLRQQVSVAGASQPQWRADGKELFFHALDQRMMAVDVAPGDTLRTGPVRQLFRTNPAVLSNYIYNYAATPDGQRFLLREPLEGSTTSVVEPFYVVTNWTALVQ